MYRYNSLVIALFLSFSLSYAKSPSNVASGNQAVSIEKKVHKAEDLLILQALMAQQDGDIDLSIKFYRELYSKTKREIYLKNAIKLSLVLNDPGLSTKLISQGLKAHPQDLDIRRLLITQLLKENKIEEAKALALRLTKDEASEQNQKLLGAIFYQLKDYEQSLKYFQNAYELLQSEPVAFQISDIYLKLNQVTNATVILEEFTKTNGCTPNICSRLIFIYGKQQNLDGLLNTYKKTYEAFRDDESAQRIVEIYLYLNKTKEAMEFLETTELMPEVLVDIYFSEQRYDEAIELAFALYNDTNDVEYLGRVSMLTYESAQNKTNVLKDVISNLETVVKTSTDPVFFNYYGYLLIDHDVDIQKGINLVKQALEIDPESSYYLDSLAWGLYKQDRCEEAYEIIEDVFKKEKNQPDIIEHYELIQKCFNNKKENK